MADGARARSAAIAELGEREGVTFVLENLNTAVDHPGVPFARAADTLALVEAVDRPHLRLNLDLYHAQIGEGNLIELVRRAAALHRRDPGRRRARPVRARHRRDQLPGHRESARRVGYHGTVGLEAWASGDDERRSSASAPRSRFPRPAEPRAVATRSGPGRAPP